MPDDTKRRSAERSRIRRVSRAVSVALGWVVVSVLSCGLTVPAASARIHIDAHGSAEQVYVTGPQPHARASLLDSTTRVAQTLRADAQGGVLFRNVRPGTGYRVRIGTHGSQSAPVTVHPDTAKPWDPEIYDQHIADRGYQYLTTRDGTKLAIDVHPPNHPAGVGQLPDGLTLPTVTRNRRIRH